MNYVECFSFAPYSVRQMFSLVNDVDSYSKFLPGCNFSKILECNDSEIIAKMNLGTNTIVKSLVTHNIFIKNKSIAIYLIQGPFKSFYGYWKFVAITNTSSKIEYVSYYEFNSIFIEQLFHRILQARYKNIVKAFIYRAFQIYGK